MALQIDINFICTIEKDSLAVAENDLGSKQKKWIMKGHGMQINMSTVSNEI